MTRFDFITHDDLRISLESDYNELQAAMGVEAHKTVHVLAGSIIEALLVEHLIVSEYKTKSNKDPLNISLEKLIEACKDEQIISQRVADLSTVIRSYRNLIHPARVIRLKEKVDGNGARVAQTLVEIIIDEVSDKRKKNYGYTSKQIISKLQRDPSAQSILDDLLRQTNKIEMEKLLFELPDIDPYLITEDYNEGISLATQIRYCFHTVFSMVSDDIRANVCKRFASIIRDGSENEIKSYGDDFFDASYLVYLSDQDKSLVKRHIIHRLPDIFFIYSRLINGIGEFIDTETVREFTDAAIKSITADNGRNDAISILAREYERLDEDVKGKVITRIDDWIRHYRDRSVRHLPGRLQAVKFQLTAIDDDLPF